MSKLHLAERLQLLIELDEAKTDAHKRKIGDKLLHLTHQDRKARGLSIHGKKPSVASPEEIIKREGVDVTKGLTTETYMKLREQGLNNTQIAKQYEMNASYISTLKNKEWGLADWKPKKLEQEEPAPKKVASAPPVLREKDYSPSKNHPWRKAFKDKGQSEEAPLKTEIRNSVKATHEELMNEKETDAEKPKFDWDSLKGTVEAISKGFNDIGIGLREPLERASNALYGTKLEDIPLEEEAFNAWKEDVIAESPDSETELTAQLNDYAPAKEEYNPITPAHYKAGGIDPFTFYAANMSDEMLRGYHVGSAIKYLIRAGKKGDALEDYQKAQEHIKQLLK